MANLKRSFRIKIFFGEKKLSSMEQGSVRTNQFKSKEINVLLQRSHSIPLFQKLKHAPFKFFLLLRSSNKQLKTTFIYTAFKTLNYKVMQLVYYVFQNGISGTAEILYVISET